MEIGWPGYLVLGSVFLVVTGGEALYADMGHFGTRPIRFDWFTVVLPSLLLNYFGQGALLLENPDAATNPFYLLAPSWAIYPMIVLAVAAAAIAAQAVISGAFSLTMQAVQLGFSPAHQDRAHLAEGVRPDLHRRHQLAADDRLHYHRAGVPHVEQSRRCVRRRGDDHDGHHDAAVLRGGARAVGLEHLDRRTAVRRSS